MIVKDSTFVKKYIKKVTKIMKMANPEWSEDAIRGVVEDMLEEQMANPEVTLDNNYTGESKDTTLISLLDWIYKREPVIAGNGTFYKNQHEALNPIANMLDDMLTNRKRLKKEMFKIENTDSAEYKDLDLGQQNEKKNCNSYYGASGAPSSAFYSKWSGPATTGTAQSVISTTEQLFEFFLVDNYKFLDVNEAFEYMEHLRKDIVDAYVDDSIRAHSREDLIQRISKKILEKTDLDDELIENYVYALSDNEVTIMYYKNNMIQFIKENKIIQDMFYDILNRVENYDYVDKKDKDWKKKIPNEFIIEFNDKNAKDWNNFVNHQYFMDPNDPPKTVTADLELLSSYVTKYVYSNYLSFDRIYRLKNFMRDVVTVIDTDSNILSLDTLINFLFETVIKDQTFGRNYEKNGYILVNTIAYIITTAVTDILLTYGKYSNIPEEFRPKYNMKNEFLLSPLVVGKAKKRYISKMKLREGNLMNPPKSDVKGFDFKKATCSELAEKYYMSLINKCILNRDATDIDVYGLKKGVDDFKKQILDSIKSGDLDFLPLGSAKDPNAYKNPASNQVYRGSLTWNFLYPDNMIEYPSKVSLVKLNIFKEEDMADLKNTHPEVYKILLDKIFNDETEIFVTKEWVISEMHIVNTKDKKWFEKIPKKYRAKYKKLGPVVWNEFAENYDGKIEPDHFEYKKKGVQVLAIPSNSKIPEWVLPYIDYSTMVNNVLSPFNPITEIFGFQTGYEGKSVNGVNRKTASVTNIIKF